MLDKTFITADYVRTKKMPTANYIIPQVERKTVMEKLLRNTVVNKETIKKLLRNKKY